MPPPLGHSPGVIMTWYLLKKKRKNFRINLILMHLNSFRPHWRPMAQEGDITPSYKRECLRYQRLQIH
jgi:hypothetical protein